LAAVSPVDGTARNWTPSPNQAVVTLAATTDTLYVGGNFTVISNVSFRNFAAFSLVDFSLQGVDASLPTFAQGITAIGATPTTLYVGGSFSGIGGEFRQNLGCLASFNASAYDWNPSPDVQPSVITLTDNLAAMGGTFRFLGQSPTNQPYGFMAVFTRAPQFLATVRTSTNTIRMLTTTGDRNDAVLQATPDLVNTNWTSLDTNGTPGFSWTVEYPTTLPQRYFRVIAR
jgi:hypothetical protein